MVVEKIKNFDWQANPVETWHILQQVFDHVVQEKKDIRKTHKHIVAWTDSGIYIGRAIRLWEKKKEGLHFISSQEPPEDELRYWVKLDLEEVPPAAVHLIHDHRCGHIALWIRTLLKENNIQDYPDNMFRQQTFLSFTKDGKLKFEYKNLIRVFEPMENSHYLTPW